MAVSSAEWLQRFAEELGVDAPGEDEVAQLLALASVAAHASERTAAPVSCYIAALAGIAPEAAQAAAERLAEVLQDSDGSPSAEAEDRATRP